MGLPSLGFVSGSCNLWRIVSGATGKVPSFRVVDDGEYSPDSSKALLIALYVIQSDNAFGNAYANWYLDELLLK